MTEAASVPHEVLRVVAGALALGAGSAGGPLSEEERRLVQSARDVEPIVTAEALKRLVVEGRDPLGDAYVALQETKSRRAKGQFLTDHATVEAMVHWVLVRSPGRVVDAGCGSGRFTAQILRSEPSAPVISVDTDPVATLITRGAIAALGGTNATVLNSDFLALELPEIDGRTAFLSNPPYVRHHDLPRELKEKQQKAARQMGYQASGLMGLHGWFILHTARIAQKDDFGCFITSAEWLDVAYGSVLRSVLTRQLPLDLLHLRHPGSREFADALTTAAIAGFTAGSESPSINVRSIGSDQFNLADPGAPIPRQQFTTADRWTALFREQPRIARALGGWVTISE